MPIDWFTVGAQTLNFLALVWLMKRFLYRPILDAIDAREKRIAAELADADAKKAQARQERDEYKQKNEAFDQQQAARLNDMTEAVQVERQRLLDDARKAADAMTAKRAEALRNEAETLAQALRQQTQDEVFSIVRQTLQDLATAGLEQQMVALFIGQLQALDDERKSGLADAIARTLEATKDPVLVRTAFDLPQPQRAQIQTAVNETFAADIHLQFETAPGLIGGIALLADGQKLSWSIEGYLEALQQTVTNLLKSRATPETASNTEPAQSEQGQ